MTKPGRHDVRLSVLGRFALEGALVRDARWGRGRAATLLKLLAIQPERTLGRDEIAAILWPGASPEHAANNLYKAVHYLRRELERRGAGRDLVQLDAHNVHLSSAIEVDLATFQRLARAARGSADPELFRLAIDAYGGELLPEDERAPWAAAHRTAANALWRETLAAAAQVSESLADLDRAIELLELLVRADPAGEPAHARLMRLYIRAGHRDRAIRQYAECREALQRSAGVAPSPETRAIYEQALGAVAIPAPAIRIAMPRAAPAVGTPVRRRRTFVGREREMEDLRVALELSLSGQGQVRLLAGEAGIGKTFMSVELAGQDALPRGVRVLWGSCIEDEGVPAYWPWTQILRSAIEGGGAARALSSLGAAGHVLEQIAGDVAPLVTGVPEPPALNPEASRFRLFDTAAMFLRNLSEETPLLIVFDDAHAADVSSLMLLRFLASELRSARIMVIVTYRDDELCPEHTLSPVLAQIAREPVAHRISLRAMEEDDVRTFIRELSGVEPTDAAVSTIYSQTEGHPFFLYQTLREALDAGRFDEIARGGKVPVNDSVRALIESRLAPLSAACRLALDAVAVLGREFTLDSLRMALGSDSIDDVLVLVEEASGARVVHETAPGSSLFHFTHSLVRETIYSDLPVTRRVALHRRIAESLEQMYGSDDAHLSELAHHFAEAAGEGEVALKAVEYAERAGQRAADALAFEQAASEYGRALRALNRIAPLDGRRRCALMLRLGAAQRAAGEHDEARATFESAASIARATGDGECFARAALAYEPTGVSMVGAVDPKAVGLLREALTMLPEGDGELRACVLALLSRALYWAPPTEERERHSDEAMAMARRLGSPSTLTSALNARHYSLGIERLEERVGIAIEIIRTTRDTNDAIGEFAGHMAAIVDFLDMGDIGAVDHELEAAARLAGELRQPYHHWMYGTRRAMRQMLDGRFEEAEHTAREAVTHGLRGHEPNALPFLGVQMLSICTELGRLRELEAPVAGFVEQFPALVAWHGTLAAIHLELGQVERARDEFERVAADHFRGLSRDPTWMSAIIRAGYLAERLGDHRRAAMVYELLSPYAGRCVVVASGLACWGAVSRVLGSLAAMLGRQQDAVRHFDAALELNRRMRAAPYLAHTRHEYARFLLDRGNPEDAPRAQDMLDSAVEAARRMHLAPLLNAASELRDRHPRV